MALSSSEREQVKNMLDAMSSSARGAALASEQSFTAWLRRTAYWLYEQISTWVTPIYHAFRLLYA